MGYKAGDFRSSAPVGQNVLDFNQWVANNPQIQAITHNQAMAGNDHAQRVARQKAIHDVLVANGQHIPSGLKINADGQLETDDSADAWKLAGKVASIAGGGVATALT